jgi:putative transposase
VNDKRVHRLWREEGLKVPYRKRKKPLRGVGTYVGAMSPICPNAIWAMDFQFDQTRDGKALKLLNIIDVFTRECLSIEVERSITADDLAKVLDRLVAQHGVPAFLRCDNGPEFVANAIVDWCRFNGSHTTFIDPGSPWQNGHCESFNSRLRDEKLNGYLFESLLEAKVVLEDWRDEYNPDSGRVQGVVEAAKPRTTLIGSGPLIGIPAICAASSRALPVSSIRSIPFTPL